MRSQKARETAWTGMLFALAIALSYLESLVSPLLGLMPAIKLGLSNIVVMYALLFDCAQAYPRKSQFSLTIPCPGGIVKA